MLSHNKVTKGKFHVRITLKDVFRFAEHQKIYGVGYKITLLRIDDNAGLNKAEAISDARNKNAKFQRYVPQYTPSIPQKGLLNEQSLTKTLTELRSSERYVF